MKASSSEKLSFFNRKLFTEMKKKTVRRSLNIKVFFFLDKKLGGPPHVFESHVRFFPRLSFIMHRHQLLETQPSESVQSVFLSVSSLSILTIFLKEKFQIHHQTILLNLFNR